MAAIPKRIWPCDFTVNSHGQIRFGMAAIKGVGEAAVEKIIEEREKNGPYKDVYDFFERIDYKSVNKKTIENLVTAGGLDSFGYHRAQYQMCIRDRHGASTGIYPTSQKPACRTRFERCHLRIRHLSASQVR